MRRDKTTIQTEKPPMFSEAGYPFSFEMYHVWWPRTNSALLMQRMYSQSTPVPGCTVVSVSPRNREHVESLHWSNWNCVSARFCQQGLNFLAVTIFSEESTQAVFRDNVPAEPWSKSKGHNCSSASSCELPCAHLQVTQLVRGDTLIAQWYHSSLCTALHAARIIWNW